MNKKVNSTMRIKRSLFMTSSVLSLSLAANGKYLLAFLICVGFDVLYLTLKERSGMAIAENKKNIMFGHKKER
jgi:hypothetical protein